MFLNWALNKTALIKYILKTFNKKTKKVNFEIYMTYKCSDFVLKIKAKY